MHLSEMIALFQELDTIKRMVVVEVIKLVKLILVVPATNAVSERSFSFLTRIETYLRSATANKLLTDRLNLTKVADEFVVRREGRKSKFGL